MSATNQPFHRGQCDGHSRNRATDPDIPSGLARVDAQALRTIIAGLLFGVGGEKRATQVPVIPQCRLTHAPSQKVAESLALIARRSLSSSPCPTRPAGIWKNVPTSALRNAPLRSFSTNSSAPTA